MVLCNFAWHSMTYFWFAVALWRPWPCEAHSQHLRLWDWVRDLKEFERFTIANVFPVKCVDSDTLFILVFWLLCSEDYKRKTQNFKSDLTHSTNSVWCLSWTSNMGNLEAVWCMRLHGIRLGCIVYVPAVASNKYDTATNWICFKLHVLSSLGKLLLKPSRRLIWEHGKGQGMFELYGFPSCACWCDTAMFALKDYRLNSYWMLHVCSWPRSSQRSPIVLCGHVD